MGLVQSKKELKIGNFRSRWKRVSYTKRKIDASIWLLRRFSREKVRDDGLFSPAKPLSHAWYFSGFLIFFLSLFSQSQHQHQRRAAYHSPVCLTYLINLHKNQRVLKLCSLKRSHYKLLHARILSLSLLRFFRYIYTRSTVDIVPHNFVGTLRWRFEHRISSWREFTRCF